MKYPEWSQRIKMIYAKFYEHVTNQNRAITPTWERFAIYIAVHGGREIPRTKSRVQRWKTGSSLEASDALMLADIFKLDLRWIISGDGEMGRVYFRSLPDWSELDPSPTETGSEKV